MLKRNLGSVAMSLAEIIIGILLLVNPVAFTSGITVITNPFSTTAVLWMFIGISLIVDAVFDMIGGILGNREKREPAVDTQKEDV